MTRGSALRVFAVAGALTLAFVSTALAQPTTPADHQHDHADAPASPGGTAPQDGAGERPAQQALPPFIPPLTDEDRQAAFPDVGGHAAHDRHVNYFVLLDQVEWQGAASSDRVNLDTTGWIGRDRDRFWFRAEGDAEDGSVGDAHAHALYGHQFSRWWDVVAGLRQDFEPGPAQTWAAVGVQGLAPYWFEVEATAYVGASGRTQARLEAEYDLRVTNRLLVQPLVEVELFGKSDAERRIGAGLSTTDAGLRVRYLLRRELAPYVGVTWSWKHGETADFAQADGEEVSGVRLVTGLRVWF
jgi:copper resistance protein B